jgi:NAD-dependent dihydropyrimidine dehydrogenase PreA subunit
MIGNKNMRYIDGVVTLTLNAEQCIGCKRCEMVCPHAVFEIQNGKAMVRDRNACMECGACAMNCPTQAVSVQAEVGCAMAIIYSFFTGGAPNCDCGCGSESNCC